MSFTNALAAVQFYIATHVFVFAKQRVYMHM